MQLLRGWLKKLSKKHNWVKRDSHFTCVLYEEIPRPGSVADNTLVRSPLREAVREFLKAIDHGTYVAGKILASDPKRTIVHQNY